MKSFANATVTASTNSGRKGSGWSLQSVNERFSPAWLLLVSQLEGVGGWKWKWSSDWLSKKMYGTEYRFCWGSSTEESLIHGPQLSNSHGWNNSQTVDMDMRMHFRSGCSDQKA